MVSSSITRSVLLPGGDGHVLPCFYELKKNRRDWAQLFVVDLCVRDPQAILDANFIMVNYGNHLALTQLVSESEKLSRTALLKRSVRIRSEGCNIVF